MVIAGQFEMMKIMRILVQNRNKSSNTEKKKNLSLGVNNLMYLSQVNTYIIILLFICTF